MAKLNIKWDGKEDWTQLSAAEKEEKIYLAALYETAATSQLEKVARLVKSPENILVFTKATPDFIGIGSTRNSMAKYWVGFGVLETNKKAQLRPRILTPSQYETALKLDHQLVSCNLIQGENFKDILVFDQAFDFSKN